MYGQRDIEDGSCEYLLSTSTPGQTVSLSDPDSPDDALDQLKNNSTIQDILSDNTNGVVVLDTRQYQLEVGGQVHTIGSAGQDNAIAYITQDGDEKASTHEVGHLYDATHEHAENWGLAEYTTVSRYDIDTCHNNELQPFLKNRFSSCNTTDIRNHIDSIYGRD
ncbi:hypothetical protein [Haloarcula sp. CBA1127]|uniref:hypothetical protein n=1 Tax=Haloarcula sp. CBA1127 TaxID=1765055 RepID=UPI000B0DBD14|nr:hypothetical protein [Haloarcula sp. CBA1127]